VNGTNAITGNGNSGTGIAMLNDLGTLTLSVAGGSAVFDLTGPMAGSGNLILGNSPISLRFNGTAGDGGVIFNFGNVTNVAYVRNTGATAIALGGLTGGPGTQLQGDNSTGGKNMAYTIGGANVDTEFDGVIKDGTVGTVALVKTGSGALTLTSTNTYTGGTTINAGTLLVKNTAGSATGSGAVTVAAGGTLAGNGIISGTVDVAAGGTLSPGGNSIGTLTFSNSLTLETDSTNIFAISHSPLTNDVLKILGAFTNDSTLIITNIGTTALAAGDTFQLFNAGSYTGTFEDAVLPPLPAGLDWDTGTLDTAGTLSVVLATTPVINSISISGSSLIFIGTGGVGNANYLVLASTNIALPLANWTRLLTNQFDGAGNFDFTNAINPNWPQTFYSLQLQ
jgi:autotransporter-associated beta strand protein